MNRSILIVICDFLLVSLLAFSNVDVNNVAENGSARASFLTKAHTNNAADSGKDLAAVMRLALDEERTNRQQLLSELTQARNTLNEQQDLLSQREQQTQTLRQQLESREQASRKLQEQLESHEKESQRLQQQQLDALQAERDDHLWRRVFRHY